MPAPRHRIPTAVPADGDDTFNELERALAINKDELDDNCIQHPDLFYRVSRALARVIADRDEAKIKGAETEAFVDAELRREASQDEARVTETAMKQMITNDPRVKLDRKNLTRLNRLVGEYSALKEAYVQRSYSLKGLIDLHLAGYFGDPSNRSDLRNRQNERADRARQSMRDQRREQRDR